MHKYAYVHGDPIGGIDPTGRVSLGSTLGSLSIGQQMVIGATGAYFGNGIRNLALGNDWADGQWSAVFTGAMILPMVLASSVIALATGAFMIYDGLAVTQTVLTDDDSTWAEIAAAFVYLGLSLGAARVNSQVVANRNAPPTLGYTTPPGVSNNRASFLSMARAFQRAFVETRSPKNRPYIISQVTMRSGDNFVGFTSRLYTGLRIFGAERLHPVVDAWFATNRPEGCRGTYGNCAEPNAVSRAAEFWEFENRVTIETFEQLRGVMEGSKIRNAIMEDGTDAAPCDYCQPFLNELGITYTNN